MGFLVLNNPFFPPLPLYFPLPYPLPLLLGGIRNKNKKHKVGIKNCAFSCGVCQGNFNSNIPFVLQFHKFSFYSILYFFIRPNKGVN